MDVSWHHAVPRRLVPREDYIVARCLGRRVLHLGFADAPLTQRRLATSTLLHTRLREVATQCTGLDFDAAAVDLIREALGLDDLIVGDAAEAVALTGGGYEVVVAGEIIEHVSNASGLISAAHDALVPGGELVVSTTNAFCLRRTARLAFGTESVHPDHVYYFSHATLRRLVEGGDFRLRDCANYRLPREAPAAAYWSDRLATLVCPAWGEGIVHSYVRR
jgi:predicted TPR repeat methyltransferase